MSRHNFLIDAYALWNIDAIDDEKMYKILDWYKDEDNKHVLKFILKAGRIDSSADSDDSSTDDLTDDEVDWSDDEDESSAGDFTDEEDEQ